ncbi:MAG: hypothetical protein GY817_03185 [bacterium]|nr:hypothetical protein [bacterium]
MGLRKKAQAMVEYILIVAFTSIAFVSVSPLLDNAVKAFFRLVGELWGNRAP